jgi:sialate O-acetylesterase
MIHSSSGGTQAQSWTSVDCFGDDPEIKGYADRAKINLMEYPFALAKFEEYMNAETPWDDTIGKQTEEALKEWQEISAKAKKDGKPLPPKPRT